MWRIVCRIAASLPASPSGVPHQCCCGPGSLRTSSAYISITRVILTHDVNDDEDGATEVKLALEGLFDDLPSLVRRVGSLDLRVCIVQRHLFAQTGGSGRGHLGMRRFTDKGFMPHRWRSFILLAYFIQPEVDSFFSLSSARSTSHLPVRTRRPPVTEHRCPEVHLLFPAWLIAHTPWWPERGALRHMRYSAGQARAREAKHPN